MPANPLSPRGLAAAVLKKALSYVEAEKPSPGPRAQVKATSNPGEEGGISIPALLKPRAQVGDARQEKRISVGSSITMETIAAAVRAASTGSMMAITDLSRETIDVDPHLGSVLQKRFGALASLPWEVQVADGPGVDKAKALFYAIVVRDQLRKLPNFRRNLMQLAWGLFDGRAALENHWAEPVNPLVDQRFGQVRVVLGSMGWIHPRLLSFGTQRQLIYVKASSRSGSNYGSIGQDLSEEGLRHGTLWRKFVSWTPQLFGEYPEKEGLAPRCLNWSFFKRFTMRDMMQLIELFGKPWRVINVPEDSSANSEDIEDSLQAVDSLGGAYTALLAKGVNLEVYQPGRTAGQIHESIIKEVDNQISKLVLGQTGTTDGVPAGLNSDQANVMQEEQLLILKNDADAISEVVERQVTDAIVELNFGPGELIHAPRFVLRSDRPADRNSEIQRLDRFLKAGGEVKVTEAYEVGGFQIPDKEDRIIRIDQPKMEPGATQTPIPRAMIIDPNEDNGTVGELFEDEEGEDGEERDKEYEDELQSAAKRQLDAPLLLKLARHLPYNDAIILCGAVAAVKNAEDEAACGCQICCATDKNSERKPQPGTKFGNPDDLITKDRKKMLGHAEKWAKAIAAAIGDTTDPKKIVKKVRAAVKKLDTKGYATSLQKRMTHGATLGALDNALDIGDIEAPDVKNARTGDVNLAFSTMPFKSALKSFVDRDIISKEEWKKVEDQIKRRSFTVAGVQTQAMREKIFAVLAGEIGAGANLRDFRKTMMESLGAAGMIPTTEKGVLSASHIDNVFRTNVLNAYNYGRKEHASQPTVLERFPVWQIRAVIDTRTRDSHARANGKMLRADDPFWETAYVPFGFECRCRVIPRPKRYLSQVVAGSTIRDLPDKGFISGYNVMMG
jgi:SPP1 gp7 family putative phage head morphogenesis protein